MVVEMDKLSHLPSWEQQCVKKVERKGSLAGRTGLTGRISISNEVKVRP